MQEEEEGPRGLSPQPKRRNERDVVQVTPKEHRHMDGSKRFTAGNESLKKRHPEYEKVLEEMPSFEIASYSAERPYLK